MNIRHKQSIMQLWYKNNYFPVISVESNTNDVLDFSVPVRVRPLLLWFAEKLIQETNSCDIVNETGETQRTMF